MCLSNKLSSNPNVIQLYDSLLTTPEATIKEQASTILKSQEISFTIQVMNVQLQKSGDMCGLYAIAMALDLCADIDPRRTSYVESKMRPHLVQCLEAQKFSLFPRNRKRSFRRRVITEVNVEVFCICRYPDVDVTSNFGDMVCCDKCGQWFHQRSSCQKYMQLAEFMYSRPHQKGNSITPEHNVGCKSRLDYWNITSSALCSSKINPFASAVLTYEWPVCHGG